MRIAVIHFCHETVTFLSNDTTLSDFIYTVSPAKGEELLGWDPESYMGGFVKVAREFDGVELIGIESPYWPKTGTGSGWISEEAFESFTGKMISELGTQGKLDGAYLALHGAMAVRGVARPEAEIARRVREALGPAAFIAATFDPHGNEDEEFLRHADLAFTVKYFPHYDSYLQGERAARNLVRAIKGDYQPAHATVKVPIITPTVLQWTGAHPWIDLVQRALVWEARKPDLFVNLFFGFPFADVPDAGMTVQAIEAGVTLAKQAVRKGASPVILADHSDRSGYATWLLREIIRQDLANTLIATIADAGVVAALEAKGVAAGDLFDMQVGGRVDPSAGEPVRISGKVIGLSQGVGRATGETWINVGFGRGNVLVISPHLAQIIEPSWLRALGLQPAAYEVIALKSRVHFRRGFDDTGFAKTIILVEPTQPFLGTTRLDALPYRNLDLKHFYPYGAPAFR